MASCLLCKAVERIEKSSYPVETSFISLQTYNDMIIAGHSLILLMKVFSEYYPDLPFYPSTFGSDSCERLFSTCHGFYRGKTNLCMLDLLQICGRIVKLEELRNRKTKGNAAASWPALVDDETVSGIVEVEREVIKTMETLGMLPLLTSSNILRASENGVKICGRIVTLEELRNRKTKGNAAASWPALVDDETVSGIVEVEREVIKTMETLGMLPLLTSSNILRASENGDIIYINPGMEMTLVDINFEPEENECMTADEQCYSHSLTDLAASSTQGACMAEGTDETIEDDDDPSHCNFFQAGTFKYADATFKPPSNTHWIGCDFSKCGRWFHELCLGLKFSSDLERQRYVFVCKSHDDINGLAMFRDCITASVSDICMQVKDEELIEESAATKTARRSVYNAGSSLTEQSL